MKIAQTIPALMLGLAATVTAGSVYVTVQAAAQQQAGAIPLPTLVEDVPADAGLEVVPASSAVSAEEVLNTRGHFLAIDEAGAFTGRLLTLNPIGSEVAGGLTVKVIKDGVEVVRTETAADGTFTASGLTDGTVALLAYGGDSFLLYAVNLKRVVQAGPMAIQEIGMSSAVVSGANTRLAKELIYGSVLDSAQDSKPRFQGAVGGSDQGSPEGDPSSPSTAVAHHDVQLDADGSLTGQVNLIDPRTGKHRSVQDLAVHFLKNGSIVGSTQVSPNGEFRMDGLQPGPHGIVSTGNDGVLALGINIVNANFAQQAGSRYKLTSVAQTLNLSVGAVTPGNFNPSFVEDGDSPPDDGSIAAAPPMTPGGFAPGGGGIGSGGGGAGGGAGGGGLGALLAGAVGAAIGYAVSDDDDNPASSPAR